MNLISILLYVFLTLKDFSLEEVLQRAGENKKEVQEFISKAKEKGYEDWAYFLLHSMPDVDLVNLSAKEFISYFDALKKNKERVRWRDKIDDFLFYHYILPHRVSQEPLENFTQLYKDTLYELIEDAKDMREAVLRINEWVFTKMKYEPTERWDQNALTTIKRGFGRCEEMANLFIKALRTVYIPTRKVYTPWWPFTDGNHAWVEVWIDGKWRFLGGGEPTELDNAWFAIPSKRVAIVLGPVYGEMEKGKEPIYKKKKGLTIINSTPNYLKPIELSVKVFKEDVPQESVGVYLCVYNYSSLPPVAYKLTDKEGKANFLVGMTDLFVYAEKDFLKSYMIYRPTEKEKDTIVLNLKAMDIPDTSFWLYTRRIEEKKRKEPSYKPNYDSLKVLQQFHLAYIKMLDSSVVDVVKSSEEKKLLKILYNSRGNGKSLASFYQNLSDTLKSIFIPYCDALPPKDLVALDTSWLMAQLEASSISKKYATEFLVPESLYQDYVLPDRILYEWFRGWRSDLQERFWDLRKANIENTVKSVVSWTEKNIQKVEERGYFGPMMNPRDVFLARRATNLERYVFIAGLLRSFGIPARIKWDYKAVEYWDGEWKVKSFEKETEEKEKGRVALKFYDQEKDVTQKMRYYYDFSVTTFEEYPKRLEPSLDTLDGWKTATLDKGKYWVITGWRNAYGDAYVRLKKVEAKEDTEWVKANTGIPDEGIRPGDLVVRKYEGLNAEKFGLKKTDIEKGNVLIIVFDTESEASRSTLKNASKAIQKFKGKIYLFAVTKNRTIAEKFLEEMEIKGKLWLIDEETYKEQWKIKELPSILYLKDGTPIFWIEGLFLHFAGLVESVGEFY